METPDGLQTITVPASLPVNGQKRPAVTGAGQDKINQSSPVKKKPISNQLPELVKNIYNVSVIIISLIFFFQCYFKSALNSVVDPFNFLYKIFFLSKI